MFLFHISVNPIFSSLSAFLNHLLIRLIPIPGGSCYNFSIIARSLAKQEQQAGVKILEGANIHRHRPIDQGQVAHYTAIPTKVDDLSFNARLASQQPFESRSVVRNLNLVHFSWEQGGYLL